MKTQTGRSETSKPAKRLRHAQHKTEAISGELKVAGGELNLTKSVLEHHMPPGSAKGDVAKALAQQGEIEEKVLEAADELLVVNELLDEEVAERARLEQELADLQRTVGQGG